MNRRDVLKSSALLFGYAVSPGTLTDLFVQCHAEAHLTWEPVFFSKYEAHLLAEVTETILPKTTTPGAKELGVPAFIDKVVKDCLSPADQQSFAAELGNLDAACKKIYGKPFPECSVVQREEYLLKLDREAPKFPASAWGITLAPPAPVAFFRRLKSMTLFGYYTSQKVGEEILNYDPIPGDYVACMPLKDVGNAWSE